MTECMPRLEIEGVVTRRGHQTITHPSIWGRHNKRKDGDGNGTREHCRVLLFSLIGVEYYYKSCLNDGRRIVVQGWAKEWVPGLVNFEPAITYNFCFSLSEKLSQPRAHFLSQPFRYLKDQRIVVSILISSNNISLSDVRQICLRFLVCGQG